MRFVKRTQIVITFAAAALLAACVSLRKSHDEDFAALAADGEALAEIVVADNPSKVASFAAAELKWHLDKMTGADFRIVSESCASTGMVSILVGRTSKSAFDVDAFSPQEFAIDVRPRSIELIGVDDPATGAVDIVHFSNGAIAHDMDIPKPFVRCATTYALYGFLSETLGVKWLDPTDYGTIVPRRATLNVPCFTKRGVPPFSYRGGTFQNGFNPSFWKSSGGAPAEAAGHAKYMNFAYHGRDYRYWQPQMRLFLLRHRALGEKANANHSFYGWYKRFWEKDDPKNREFVEYRPEYFAKIPKGSGRPGQLCYTEPGVIEQTIKDVRAYFDGPVENRIWGENCVCLEPMDNADFCPCERCRAEYEPERAADNSQHSTHWFRFVNKVAREVAKTHPGKRVNTLAYWSHEGVPSGEKIEENVMVYFCIFHNRMPYRQKSLEKQMNRLKEWMKAYPGRRFAMWLYNTFPLENYNYAGVIGVPGFFAHHAEKQFDVFRSGDFSQGIYHCGMNGSIDSYLQFKWMLDPSLRADDMLDEYFSACGPAAPALRKFYDLVEERYCSPEFRPEGVKQSSLECSWKHVCPPEIMDRLAALMDEAEQAVASSGSEFEKARVRLFRLEVWEYMLAGVRQYETQQTVKPPVWNCSRIAEANGDIAGVDWAKIAPDTRKLLYSGAELASPVRATMRFANDSTHLYLELELTIKTPELRNFAYISYCDDIELYFASEKNSAYRTYFSSPNGRIRAGAFGKGKWDVAPAKELRPAFGAKCVSDTSRNGLWRTRYAFPLKSLVDKPLKPGDSVYLNVASVLHPSHVGRVGSHTVLISTSYSGLHDTGRIGTVVLAP